MHLELPLSASSETRSSLNAQVEEITIDPAVLGQRTIDTHSNQTSLVEISGQHPSQASISVIETRKSKKGRIEIDLQPPRKRQRRLTARMSAEIDSPYSSMTEEEMALRTLEREYLPAFNFNLSVKEYLGNFTRISGILQARMRKKGIDKECITDVQFMANVILSIASPASFHQLGQTLKALRNRKSFRIPEVSLTVSEIVYGLNALDIDSTANTLLRRFVLMHFAQKKVNLKKEIMARRGKIRGGGREGGDRSGKIATLVLDEMLEQAYHSDED